MRAIATYFLSALLVSGPVLATEIQMLPPKDANGVVCTGGNEVLTYSADSTPGHAGVNCMPVTIGNGGNVTTAGSVTANSVTASGGEVQTSNSGAACTSSNAGAIRYDQSSSTFLGCNGTAWKSLGGDSGQMAGWCEETNHAITNLASIVPPAFAVQDISLDYRPFNRCACPSGYQIVTTGLGTSTGVVGVSVTTHSTGWHDGSTVTSASTTIDSVYYTCIKK